MILLDRYFSKLQYFEIGAILARRRFEINIVRLFALFITI